MNLSNLGFNGIVILIAAASIFFSLFGGLIPFV